MSIIIPTFNRSYLLGETLDSIIAQTHSNWECIVVDDGSSDYTEELMGFYVFADTRISFLNRPFTRSKGANACRNYGFELSKGDYVNWFDDDDIMQPEKLELQLRSLENSNLSFSVCQTLVFQDTVNNFVGLRNKMIISNQAFHDYLTMKIGWMTPSALWKKDFLREHQYLFDEDIKAAQEWEFHLRMLNKSPEYVVIDKALVYIRKHEHSITYSHNQEQKLWYYFQARLRIYKNNNLDLGVASKHFLKEYLLNSFKKMIITKNSNVIKAYKLFILPEKRISFRSKINALLAIEAFKIFKRGNSLLQKIKYK